MWLLVIVAQVQLCIPLAMYIILVLALSLYLLFVKPLVIAHGSLVYGYSAAGHSLGVALHFGSGGLYAADVFRRPVVQLF
jgi:hypothetical protein